MKSRTSKFLAGLAAILGLAGASYAYAQCQCTAPPPQSATVTTYHNDTLRTGWNQNETFLTASAFPSAFRVTHTVSVDDQVDAQPLFMSALQIAGGTHDVVYAVTESNTVYAIDAGSGAILVSRNLGPAVPNPLGCSNNPPNIGTTGTPVIDPSTGIMYLITYLNNGPTYQIHAIDISTLQDRIAPVTVSGLHTLTDGTTFNFNASVERQRVGLLLQDGAVYAGFASFCDFAANQSRGWVLGWNASNLAALASNELTDQLTTATTNFFLSSIWMSGYGLAGAAQQVFFTTGNSASGTYTGSTNIQESAVGLNETSFSISQLFTESDHDALDNGDTDFGSGGLMLLPDQAGSVPHLAVAAGKDGILYLLNRDSFSSPIASYNSSGCWCGPAYFVGADGVPRIVTSQGATVQTRRVNLSSPPSLSTEYSKGVSSGQDPGFFTSISSNGTTSGSAIIWAVLRGNPLMLSAFNASGLGLLYSSSAGPYPYGGGDANQVPTVANGRVYVGAYKTLTIFGAN